MAEKSSEKVSKKDIVVSWAKYLLCAEVSSGFERLTAPAFSYGIKGVLTKLYKGNKEELKNALERHLMFYNSEAIWGSIIMGVAIALEEEHSNLIDAQAPEEQINSSSEMINGLKLGLMGPLAGIGDTVNHAMIRPLLLSAFIPLAAQGNWSAGVLPFIIWAVLMSSLGYILALSGYKSGRLSIVSLLESGRLNQFIQGASVLGLFMMGALSSEYINFETVLQWTDATGEVVQLQTLLNNIYPQLLPLLVVFGIFAFFKIKGPKYIAVLITILISSLVLAYFGIV